VVRKHSLSHGGLIANMAPAALISKSRLEERPTQFGADRKPAGSGVAVRPRRVGPHGEPPAFTSPVLAYGEEAFPRITLEKIEPLSEIVDLEMV
jgi:hypothetical protein